MKRNRTMKKYQDNYIPNFDHLFDDEIFLKSFLKYVIKTCNNLKYESKNEFDFIFKKENKRKTNIYVIIDYNILSISFISFLISEYDDNNFYKEIVKLFLERKDYYEKNLLISLAKRNIIYFNFRESFYKEYALYRYTKEELFILFFKGIAMKLNEIKNVLNEEVLNSEFTKLIKSNYRKYYRNKKNKNNQKKEKNYFYIEESKLFKNTFYVDKKDDY